MSMLLDGALTPTAAPLLAPVLTMENMERLLAAAAYRSKREIEVLIAGERPRPDVKDAFRKLPDSHAVGPSAAAAAAPSAEAVRPGAASPVPARESPTAPAASFRLRPRPAVVAPLAADRYEVRFTASAVTC